MRTARSLLRHTSPTKAEESDFADSVRRGSQWVFDQRGGSGVQQLLGSNEQRRGSDRFSATALDVDENARSRQ